MTNPLLLASASPRRRRLLALLGVAYDVEAFDVPEDVPDQPTEPDAFAAGLAADKARAALDHLARRQGGSGADPHAVAPAAGAQPTLIGADTIVVLDDRILGKPADIVEAEAMLHALSGRTHRVVTAIAVVPSGGAEPSVEVVSSQVDMRDLDDHALAAWLAGDQVLGCAGAYNIESHLASVAPTQCFQNVAGLPLCHLHLMLERIATDLPGLSAPRERCEDALGITCELGRSLIPNDD